MSFRPAGETPLRPPIMSLVVFSPRQPPQTPQRCTSFRRPFAALRVGSAEKTHKTQTAVKQHIAKDVISTNGRNFISTNGRNLISTPFAPLRASSAEKPHFDRPSCHFDPREKPHFDHTCCHFDQREKPHFDPREKPHFDQREKPINLPLTNPPLLLERRRTYQYKKTYASTYTASHSADAQAGSDAQKTCAFDLAFPGNESSCPSPGKKPCR